MATLAEASLSVQERRALERFARDLERQLGDELRGVWLYGSRARGERTGPESDVDLPVIHRDQAGARAYSGDAESGGRARRRQPLLLLPPGLEPRRAGRGSRHREVLHPGGRSRPRGDSRGSRRPAGGQSAGSRASTWRGAPTDQGAVGGSPRATGGRPTLAGREHRDPAVSLANTRHSTQLARRSERRTGTHGPTAAHGPSSTRPSCGPVASESRLYVAAAAVQEQRENADYQPVRFSPDEAHAIFETCERFLAAVEAMVGA